MSFARPFDVIHDPTKHVPDNRARIIHPDGEAGSDDPKHRAKLAGAFKGSCTGAK